MAEPPTGRSNKDGFRGEYPTDGEDWAEQMYRAAGMEPPWLLEYEDGHVVSRAMSTYTEERDWSRFQRMNRIEMRRKSDGTTRSGTYAGRTADGIGIELFLDEGGTAGFMPDEWAAFRVTG